MSLDVLQDSFTDSRDGEVYKTVKIGNQIWMAENLRYKPNNNFLDKFGYKDPVFLDYAEAVSLVYDLIHAEHHEILEYQSLLEKHLITKDDVNPTILKLIEDRQHHKKLELTRKKWSKFGCLYRWTHHIKKYAPDGWRIPSNTDFMNLAKFLEQYEKPAVVLKSKTHWKFDKYYGNGGSDEFGFCALPSGFFYIEDKHRTDLFNLVTDLVLNVGYSANFWTMQKGAMDNDFSSSSSVYWSINHYHRNEYPIEVQHKQDFLTNNFVSRDTFYAIRCIKEECSVADNKTEAIKIYTPPKPQPVVPESIQEEEPWTPQFGSFKDKRDGRIYRTVIIGNQEWFAEDLKYNSDGLYTYSKAIESIPEGWHLPTRIEIDELRDFCRSHSKNHFGTVIKSKYGWLPCTEYYNSMNPKEHEEAMKNCLRAAPLGTDRFGLSIAPSSAETNPYRKGKRAWLWLDSWFDKKKYLCTFSYIRNDYFLMYTKESDNCIVRCMRTL